MCAAPLQPVLMEHNMSGPQSPSRAQRASVLHCWGRILQRSVHTMQSPLLLLALAVAGHGAHPAFSSETLTSASVLAAGAASARYEAKRPTPGEALAVVEFWRAAGPNLWFAKDPEFDRRFRERFLALYEAAARGELDDWQATPDGALALVIILDQYPRNAFRGKPRMYATDALARTVADVAIARSYDVAIEPALQLFFYLPFGHSEDIADQERSVALARRLGQPSLGHAEHHRDIIRRFGRFPHRNPILGRPMTEAEPRYIDEGGFRG
jgi:uncharacterized protein (DUF924 family)